MKRSVGCALAVLSLAVACTNDHRADKAPNGPLRVIRGTMSGFAVNGRLVAWEGDGRVVAADLDSGRRVAVARGHGNPPVPMALSGSTVLWLDITGGNVRKDTLLTASPGRRRKTLANWYEETSASVPIGTFLGGVTGRGKTLAFALYRLAPPGGNPDACYERPCRRHVAGGGTFTIIPGSLALHRVLPPAQAVAATDHILAAAVLRKGAVYTGRAQLVVKDLSNGTRRSFGAPASIRAVGLDRNRVAALIGTENGPSKLVRVWNLATGRLVRMFHVGQVRPVLVLAGSHAVLSYGVWFFTLDIRTGRQHPFKPLAGTTGPWVSGGRVLWVESYDQGLPKARSVIRSAPLPGPAG